MKFKRKLIQTIPELICQFVAKKFEKKNCPADETLTKLNMRVIDHSRFGAAIPKRGYS